MRLFILLCAASCLPGSFEVRADSPDCDAIRTSLIPYQITLTKDHSVWRALHTIQVTRAPLGSDTTSARVNSTTSYVRKGTTQNGLMMVDDIQYVRRQSATRLMHATYTYENIDPKHLDRRSNQKFSVNMKWGEIGRSTNKSIADVSYKYVKAENVTIGACTFMAILGEQTLTDRTTEKAETTFLWHFPDLRLTVGNPSPDVTFQSISTTFEPIEFAEPNFPPAPQKADND